MKNRQIILLVIAGLLIICINGKAEAETWKMYYKNNNIVFYYDKDSIHYPYTKQAIFGLILKDKNIVRAWTRLDTKSFSGMELDEINCSKRTWRVLDQRGLPMLPGLDNDNSIVPGTNWEGLFNILCN
jgi:hypothetical protein